MFIIIIIPMNESELCIKDYELKICSRLTNNFFQVSQPIFFILWILIQKQKITKMIFHPKNNCSIVTIMLIHGVLFLMIE